MDKQNWQQQVQSRAGQFKAWLTDRANRDAPYVIYGGLMTSTLWPVIESVIQTGNIGTFWVSLTGAVGTAAAGVGAGLIANQLEAWKAQADTLTEEDVATWVVESAADNSELRDLFNSLLLELDAVPALAAALSETEQQRLTHALQQELAHLGTPSNTIKTITGSGNLVIQGSTLTGDHVKVAHTIIEQQTIIQPDDSAEARRAKLKKRYLGRLAHRCNLLPLAALGGEQSTKESVLLDDIYISLDTTTREPLTEAEQEKQRGSLGLGRETERPLSAMEVATEHRCLALLGDPGSGKSTFVRQVVAKLAQARLGLDRPPDGWPAQGWPILTLLRDLAPRLSDLPLDEPPTAGQEQALVEAVKAQWQADLRKLEVAELAADLPHLLTDEAVVLVFDGLDEIPEALRRHVRLAVQAVLKAYPGIERVVITCRIRSYVGAAVLPAFANHTLAPFGETKIKDFVEAWYQTQARLGRLTPAQAEERIADLQQAALSAALQELATNPMLLTTMAIIHQRETELPRERVRLYDEAVKVLLSRWQRHKEITVTVQLQAVLTDHLKLRRIIERLAYEIHRRQSQSRSADATDKGDLPRLEALGLLEETAYLGDLSLANQFLDYVDQRAGLLQGRGGEEGNKAAIAYTFPHRTFQEYLAGCRLVSGRSVSRDYWQRLAEGDFWYLAGQLGAEELLFNRRSPESLLDLAYALCPAPEPDTATAWRAIVWSGRMAVTLGRTVIEADAGTPDGGARYFQRLTERLKQSLAVTDLSAIERAEAGRALGRLKADDRPGVALRADGLPDIIWCDVPAGSFTMGSDKETDSQAYDDETPQHPLELPAYKISRYPITNGQFAAFVEAEGYHRAGYWPEAEAQGFWQPRQVQNVIYYLDDEKKLQKRVEGWRSRPYDYGEPYNLANHPVVGVSWYEALAFCRWLEEQVANGKFANLEINQAQQQLWATIQSSIINRQSTITLPSEAEWEKAARGTDGRRYPWANEPDPNRANYADTGLGTTSAVGCFPQGASPYGVEEMSGNVWEWTRSLWGEDVYNPTFKYPYKATDGREELAAGTEIPRVLRGGAFDDNERNVRCASRSRYGPDFDFKNNGFRVCVSPLA